MKTVAISEYGAICFAALERVRKTGEPILVTRRGKSVAQVVAQVVPPPQPETRGGGSFGCMAEWTTIKGDILAPLPEEDWKALHS